MKDQSKELEKIEQGFCPKCKHNTIEMVDIRGGGCSPKIITYRCISCGYENSFTKSNTSCTL